MPWKFERAITRHRAAAAFCQSGLSLLSKFPWKQLLLQKYCGLVCEIWYIMCVSGPHQCVSMVQGQGDQAAFCHGHVWPLVLESRSAKDGCGVPIHFPWVLRCRLSLPYPLEVGLPDGCMRITGIDPGKIKSHLPWDWRLWPFLYCLFRLHW